MTRHDGGLCCGDVDGWDSNLLPVLNSDRGAIRFVTQTRIGRIHFHDNETIRTQSGTYLQDDSRIHWGQIVLNHTIGDGRSFDEANDRPLLDKALEVVHRHDRWTAENLKTILCLESPQEHVDRFVTGRHHEPTVAQGGIPSQSETGNGHAGQIFIQARYGTATHSRSVERIVDAGNPVDDRWCHAQSPIEDNRILDAPLEAKFLSVAQFDLSNQAVNHEHRSTIEIFDDLLDFSEVFRCGTDNDTVTFGFRDHDDFPTEGNTDRIAAVTVEGCALRDPFLNRCNHVVRQRISQTKNFHDATMEIFLIQSIQQIFNHS